MDGAMRYLCRKSTTKQLKYNFIKLFKMKIDNEKFVALSYKLTVDGSVVDEAKKESPLKFVYGTGYLLPKFEENIAGLSVGETFGFTLTPEEGYGTVDPQKIIDVAKDVFMINGKIEENLLFLGNMIPMMTSNGMHVMGKVIEITDNNVKMDFNHPMAGRTLNFSGEIVEVRDATDDDYPHSHSCGEDCSCDSCGGDCGSHDCSCGSH